MSKEEWRPVKDYVGIYEVSRSGRVRSLARTVTYKNGYRRHYDSYMFPLNKGTSAYIKVTLSKDGRSSKEYVHRLVCEAFNTKTHPLRIHVNHINTIKTDNRAENLEWCTNEENLKPSWKMGLSPRGSNHYGAKLVDSQVLEICRRLDEGEYTRSEVSLQFEITEGHVGGIYYGECWNWLTDRKGKIPRVDISGINNSGARPIRDCRGEVFGTTREAALKYGISSPSAITKACKGRQGRKHAGKYKDGTKIKWFYVDNK